MSDTPNPICRQTILIVDDTPDNIVMLSSLLKDHYRTKVATNGERALKIAAADPPPDLILLDIMMPGMDGYEVCQRLKADIHTSDIPVIFLTAKTQEEDEEKGLRLGGVDYITKPINPPIVLARVETQLTLKNARQFLQDRNAFLEAEVQRRTEEIVAIQDAIILTMAALAEARDNETGNHIRRTQHYIRALANRLKHHPRFDHFLNEETIRQLFKSAPLHDIGKVAIPDRILLKPGRLTPEEFEIMKTHTTLGRDAILTAEKHLSNSTSFSSAFLQMAQEIAYSHQERWDGAGYPEGLAGDAIPISARLMAVADVYDALISWRIYKPAMSHEEAVRIIREGRGNHFDPDIVDAFLEITNEFQAIAAQFADTSEVLQEAAKRLELAIVEEHIVLGGDKDG
ncbi:MAG TPA: two-component system response regulator [Candidatus Competibacteraceae bacterium]|nr:two-component system response regulator [Candidatus Competibacteraceae bacterium]